MRRGIVATLGELMPVELALAGGGLTWRAGPLRKGGGLCHGTAGNGFAGVALDLRACLDADPTFPTIVSL